MKYEPLKAQPGYDVGIYSCRVIPPEPCTRYEVHDSFVGQGRDIVPRHGRGRGQSQPAARHTNRQRYPWGAPGAAGLVEGSYAQLLRPRRG